MGPFVDWTIASFLALETGQYDLTDSFTTLNERVGLS
jgi:hypothetical protein